MKTLIIGASTNPERYSYKAAHSLLNNAYEIVLFGVKKGELNGHLIENTWNPDWKIDTVTMYINPQLQENYYENIIALKPRRVIFNPGTENRAFTTLLQQNGIETEEACTLVLLAMKSY
jgi:uncharacterized protein